MYFDFHVDTQIGNHSYVDEYALVADFFFFFLMYYNVIWSEKCVGLWVSGAHYRLASQFRNFVDFTSLVYNCFYIRTDIEDDDGNCDSVQLSWITFNFSLWLLSLLSLWWSWLLLVLFWYFIIIICISLSFDTSLAVWFIVLTGFLFVINVWMVILLTSNSLNIAFAW